MNSAALLARLVLVLLFATAGIAKLSDLQASRDTVEAFGLPRRLAAYAGTALPVAELVVAFVLLPTVTARWAAVAALVLLVTFSAGVAYALSQGRTPDCNCFGQVSSEQIGTHTLVRNGVFGLITAFAIWKAPGSPLTAWTHDGSAANLVAVVLALAAVLLGLTAFQYRQRALAAAAGGKPSQPESRGVAIGSPAPDFALQGLDGELISRDDLLARGRPVMLIFASPTCGPCVALMPEVGRWSGAMNESVTFAVIESGATNSDGLREQLRPVGDTPVLMDETYETATLFGANATPTGVALNADGTVASPPLPGQSNIEALVRTVLGTASTTTADRVTAAAESR